MRPPSTTALLASSMSATVLSTLLGLLAGYYIGKSSGMNTSETISTLKDSGAVNSDDEFRPKTGKQSLESSVVDLGAEGEEGESGTEEDSEDEGAEDGISEFKESSETNCKMVRTHFAVGGRSKALFIREFTADYPLGLPRPHRPRHDERQDRSTMWPRDIGSLQSCVPTRTGSCKEVGTVWTGKDCTTG